MYLYVELWKARPAWLALSPAERAGYMQQVEPAIGQLLGAGIELLGFALSDADTLHGTEHTYLAAWRMPSKELALTLEHAVDGAKWHVFFEQVNARGAIMSPPDALAHMVAGAKA
jgi:hypothetical protein